PRHSRGGGTILFRQTTDLAHLLSCRGFFHVECSHFTSFHCFDLAAGPKTTSRTRERNDAVWRGRLADRCAAAWWLFSTHDKDLWRPADRRHYLCHRHHDLVSCENTQAGHSPAR